MIRGFSFGAGLGTGSDSVKAASAESGVLHHERRPAAGRGRRQHSCPCFGAASKIVRDPPGTNGLRLSGSITALATPFTAAGEIDLDAWRRLLQRQLDGGTQALVVAGSTGEAAALQDVEYDALLRVAVETVGGRVPVLAGTGHSSTAGTI